MPLINFINENVAIQGNTFQHDKIYCCIAFLLFFLLQSACSSCTKADKTVTYKGWIDVVILAGQSNMEGSNTSSHLPAQYLQPVPNALIYAKKDSNHNSKWHLETLSFGVNNNWRSTSLEVCGSEIAMAFDYTNITHKKLGIIKYSLGGSGLVDDGVDTAVYGLWDVDASPMRAGAWGKHYNRLVQNFVIPGLQAFKDAGYSPHICAFVWTQGETDAKDSFCAGNYEHKLEQLINQFKTDLSPYDSTIQSMHILISRTHNHLPAATFRYTDNVRLAQQKVAAYFGTYGHLINTDNYEIQNDNVHFTKPGQVQHGLDISKVLKQVIQ